MPKLLWANSPCHIVKKVLKYILYLLLAAHFLVGMVAIRVYTYGKQYYETPADVGIVLGHSLKDSVPSPLFKGRIDHGVYLYRKGVVRYLLFTGGKANMLGIAEAEGARRYALAQGIPDSAIIVEPHATDTYQNLVFAHDSMRHRDLHTALLVSDPLHMMRSMAMARKLGMAVQPSPTRTSHYADVRTARFAFACYEAFFYVVGWCRGIV